MTVLCIKVRTLRRRGLDHGGATRSVSVGSKQVWSLRPTPPATRTPSYVPSRRCSPYRRSLRACTLGSCPSVRAPRTPWRATQWPARRGGSHPVGLPPAPSLGHLRGAPPSLAPVWAARARPGWPRPPQRPRGAAPGAPPHQPPPRHPPAPRPLGAGAAAARLLTSVRPPTATQQIELLR